MNSRGSALSDGGEGDLLFTCVELSRQRHHEMCLDTVWEAFCDCGLNSGPQSVVARHWTRYVSLGGGLLEVDEEAEAARRSEEMRSHIIRAATNRCSLLLSCREGLQPFREKFLFSDLPPEAFECEVDLSLRLESLGETADFQCHRALVRHFNHVAAANRTLSGSPFDRVVSQSENLSLAKLDAVANSISLEAAQYFPVELRCGSSSSSAVVRIDVATERSGSGTLFIGTKEFEPRTGMALERIATVRCGSRVESFTSTLGVLK